MKTLLLIILSILLIGCESDTIEPETNTPEIIEPEVVEPKIIEPEKDIYIVAGQSNAGGCDWSYFEDLTGSTVINVYRGGHTIDALIENTTYSKIEGVNAKSILFVHGETDGVDGTSASYYIEKVLQYQELLGGHDLYISNVGYYKGIEDYFFDDIRNSVTKESLINDSWFIAFDESKYFRNWGMLLDGIHYTDDGCMMMMDAFAEQTYK